jgi:hypothetical protein
LLAGGERGGKLRPIIPFAALDLDEFFGELPIPAVQLVEHGFALRFEAETALAPPVRRAW